MRLEGKRRRLWLVVEGGGEGRGGVREDCGREGGCMVIWGEGGRLEVLCAWVDFSWWSWSS